MSDSLYVVDHSNEGELDDSPPHFQLSRSATSGRMETTPHVDELIHIASLRSEEFHSSIPGNVRRSRQSVSRRKREALPIAAVLKWAVRLALLSLLGGLTCKQALEFLSEPLSSTVVRRQARFPRLTLCPGGELKDTFLMRDKLKELANGSLTIIEFYNQTSLHMLKSHNSINNLMLKHGKNVVSSIPGEGPLGAWKSRFYLPVDSISKKFAPMRCITFHPSARLHTLGANIVSLTLQLRVAPLFTGRSDVSYRLYVHGEDEPNVGDLTPPAELGLSVPTTTLRELRKSEGASLRVTARLRRLANLRRRPCRPEPGYSLTQCLKECLWRRLAAHIGCRLPHMVAADAYLPEIRGPVDHLPLCTKFVGREKWRMVFCHRPSDESCLKESFGWSTPIVKLPGSLVMASPEKLRARKFASPSTRNETRRSSQLRSPFPEKCHSPPKSTHHVPFEVMSDLKGCDCQPACHQAVYYLQEDATGSNVYTSGSVGTCETLLALRVDLAADRMEESGTFTLLTLLANLGGLVGLITGFSLFTVSNIAEALIHRTAHERRYHHEVEAADSTSKNRVQFVGQWSWQPRKIAGIPPVGGLR